MDYSLPAIQRNSPFELLWNFFRSVTCSTKLRKNDSLTLKYLVKLNQNLPIFFTFFYMTSHLNFSSYFMEYNFHNIYWLENKMLKNTGDYCNVDFWFIINSWIIGEAWKFFLIFVHMCKNGLQAKRHHTLLWLIW